MLAALCFATAFALALGSYLTLCQRSLEMSTRDMHATRCIELAELGLEDALWALNSSDWAGWTISGTTASRTITGFAFESGVAAEVRVTVTRYNVPASEHVLTGTGITLLPGGTRLSRTLTCRATPTAVFVNALAATTGPVVFSNGGSADSYDSSRGAYATQTPTFSAIVASTAPVSASSTVQLVNARIKGYVASNSSNGPSYSTGATLCGPASGLTTKVDPRRISNNPYQPSFPIKTITAAGTVLEDPETNSTTILGSPAATAPAVYYSTGLDLQEWTKIIIDGPVQLVVSGPLYIGLCCDNPDSCFACLYGGKPSIDVTANGTLEVFAEDDISIRGGGINNLTQDPRRVAIYGTNTLSVPDMHTTTPFYGVTYTPEGNFTVMGNTTIYGAIIAKKLSLTGPTPVIHYDLNLRTAVFAGVQTVFAINGWRETTNDH